jgi:hypothetical protein
VHGWHTVRWGSGLEGKFHSGRYKFGPQNGMSASRRCHRLLEGFNLKPIAA